MSHWGYVIESLVNEDRGAAERRKHARRRQRRAREQAVLDEAETVVTTAAAEARIPAQPAPEHGAAPTRQRA